MSDKIKKDYIEKGFRMPKPIVISDIPSPNGGRSLPKPVRDNTPTPKPQKTTK